MPPRRPRSIGSCARRSPIRSGRNLWLRRIAASNLKRGRSDTRCWIAPQSRRAIDPSSPGLGLRLKPATECRSFITPNARQRYREESSAASRASIWPRDHFCRSTIAPPRSRPTTWNEFLPISMPIVAMVAIDLLDMAVLRLTLAPSQHHSPVGQEHGRTIPLAVIQRSATLDQLPESIPEPKASGRKLGTVHLAQCCPRGKLTGAKDRASKFALHPLNYLCPVSDLLLSKQPRARVPWAVVSVQQPSPIAIVGQQNQDRFD